MNFIFEDANREVTVCLCDKDKSLFSIYTEP